MSYLPAFVLFVIGGFIGMKFADFDHAFRWSPLIVHRSLLTHGLLVPLLLYRTIGKNQDPASRLLVMGFCLTTAVHLAFDLFPVLWRGYAYVFVPFYGRIGTLPSVLWLLAGVLVSLCLAFKLPRNTGDLMLCLAGLIVGYGITASAAPRTSFFALVVLVSATVAALALSSPGFGASARTNLRRLFGRA